MRVPSSTDDVKMIRLFLSGPGFGYDYEFRSRSVWHLWVMTAIINRRAGPGKVSPDQLLSHGVPIPTLCGVRRFLSRNVAPGISRPLVLFILKFQCVLAFDQNIMSAAPSVLRTLASSSRQGLSSATRLSRRTLIGDTARPTASGVTGSNTSVDPRVLNGVPSFLPKENIDRLCEWQSGLWTRLQSEVRSA